MFALPWKHDQNHLEMLQPVTQRDGVTTVRSANLTACREFLVILLFLKFLTVFEVFTNSQHWQ